MRKELSYFRDQQGLDVDFLVPRPLAGLWLLESKAGKTVWPAMAGSTALIATLFGAAVGAVGGGPPKVALVFV